MTPVIRLASRRAAPPSPMPPVQGTPDPIQLHAEAHNALAMALHYLRQPAGVNVPGYHLHFISRNRAQGGHLLALELASGTAQVDVLDRWALQLPRTKDFAEVDLARDRRQELTGVEKDRPMK